MNIRDGDQRKFLDPVVWVPVAIFISGVVGVAISNKVTLDESARQIERLSRQVEANATAVQVKFDRLDTEGTSYIRSIIQVHNQRLDQLERGQTVQDQNINSMNQIVNTNSGRISVLESRINRVENPTP